MVTNVTLKWNYFFLIKIHVQNFSSIPQAYSSLKQQIIQFSDDSSENCWSTRMFTPQFQSMSEGKQLFTAIELNKSAQISLTESQAQSQSNRCTTNSWKQIQKECTIKRKGKEQDYLGDKRNLINEGINSVYCQRCKPEDLKQKEIIQKQLRR